MLANSELIFKILGSLVFLGSLGYFFNRARAALKQSKNRRKALQYLPYDLFLGLTSLCIVLVIWLDSLKGSFWLLLVSCGLGAWAVQRAVNRTSKT